MELPAILPADGIWRQTGLHREAIMPRSTLTGVKPESASSARTSSSLQTGAKLIKVHLDQQVVEAYEGSERVFRFECVTGELGKTDRGTFRIREKFAIYRSRTYNVQMNYAMFFTPDRKGFHQYHGPMPISVLRHAKRHLTDFVGSKGCVRLTEEDARTLFEWTPEPPVKTKVVIS